MLPHPLHPAVVHFPVVLAVLLPAIALVGLLASRRPGAGRGPWMVVAAFAILLPLSAGAAVLTGQAQEDVVEDVVGEGPIHDHEEAAEAFLVVSAVLAGLVLAGLLGGRMGRLARLAAVPGAVAVLVLSVVVGDSGGKLVYTHGAASAYVGASGPGTPGAGVLRGGEREREDEGRNRRGRQR